MSAVLPESSEAIGWSQAKPVWVASVSDDDGRSVLGTGTWSDCQQALFDDLQFEMTEEQIAQIQPVFDAVRNAPPEEEFSYRWLRHQYANGYKEYLTWSIAQGRTGSSDVSEGTWVSLRRLAKSEADSLESWVDYFKAKREGDEDGFEWKDDHWEKSASLLTDFTIADIITGVTGGIPFERLAKFQLQSAWADVMSKAKRLVQENKVTILQNTPQSVIATVVGDGSDNDGDPDMHQVELAREDPNSNVLTQTVCDCSWNQYSYNRSGPYKKFEARPCHLPGSRVTLADGTYKAIEDVQVGDQVLTHDGIGTVRETMQRPYHGNTYHIYRWGFPRPLRITENHEVWSLTLPEDVRAAEYNQGNAVRIYDPSFLTETPEWIDAQHLQTHDWVASTFVDRGVSTNLDSSYATILGFYLAEGNLVKKNGRHTEIQWTLNIDETMERQLLVDALACRGKSVRTYERPKTHAMSIRLYDPELAEWLYRMGGHLASHKILAPEILAWPKAHLELFLEAYFLGDGDMKKDGRQTINTSSEALAQQIFDIVVKLGMIPSWNVQRQKGGPTNRDKKCLIHRVQWISHKRRTASGRLRLDTRYLSKIKKIDVEEYCGPVFNLSVDHQESYVTEGVVNHNCSHILATYWKAKSTPLDGESLPADYKVPVGQRGPATPAGQQVIPIPQQEPAETAAPEMSPELPSTQEMTTPAPQQNPFAPPKNPKLPGQGPRVPQRQQLQLFNLSPPPATTPPAAGVSVPGGTPVTPENPIGIPGTFSSWQVQREPIITTVTVSTIRADGFVRFASDELINHFDAARQVGETPYVALKSPQSLELRSGKIPIPGAMPYDVSSEGVPLYKMMDLGWNPDTQQREGSNPGAIQGAPEQRGTYAEMPANKRGEVRDWDHDMKWAYVHVPLSYPNGEDARLHAKAAAGWVPYSQLRVVHPPGSPFIKRR